MSTPGGTVQSGADLAECAREPIHIPGSIQPHGVLLAIDNKGRIAQLSVNAAEHLGRSFDELTGRGLDALFATETAALLRTKMAALPAGEEAAYLGTAQTLGRNSFFHIIGHRQAHSTVLEFEPAPDGERLSLDIYTFVRSFSHRLKRVKSVSSLVDMVAQEVRILTGFDRVLVYRFDENWNGHVIAESKIAEWSSYFDLWFPESDIPQQARELYRINRIRLIADAAYRPVPIEPALDPATRQPLDLRFSTLRSVSPVHLEYLANMGVRCSMSISLLTEDGRLWGLIACHHRTPHFVPFEKRLACDLLAQELSMQIAIEQQRDDFERRLRLKSITAQLLQAMAEAEDLFAGLEKHPRELMSFAGAAGVALVSGEQFFAAGDCPPEEAIRKLVDWLVTGGRQEVFYTDSLAAAMPDAQAMADKASGVLAISLSKIHPSYLLWLRPEAVRTVSWGGDPRKAATAEEGSPRIHPRVSFESWKESVRQRSFPWHPTEIEAAAEMRHAMIGIVLRKAEELAQLSEELQRSNRELEAFSYSVSHDLRAPFRHIVGYSELLKQSSTARLDANDLRYLDVIMQSAQFAGTLVDNLLSFSQVGRAKLKLQTVSTGRLVREVIADLDAETGGRRIRWVIAELPEVVADLTMFRLVWQNLLQNAVKYTRAREEATIEIEVVRQAGEFVFSVKDNGVGFEQQYVGKLFGIFQRLHKMEEYEGTGVGLAHVRRIVTRHGGNTWAEGQVDEGATIYFSLPIRPVPAADVGA